MIELDHVSFHYTRSAPILSGYTLRIQEGERIALLGRSGAGKSTVLRLLMGLERPRRGSVLVPEGIRISAVFQEDRLIPWKSVYENVILFAGSGGPRAREAVSDSEKERVYKVLGDLGLAEAADLLPAELSGGMKRRAALARALLHPSELLILDEAFTGLDDETKEQCLAVTDREAAGRTVVMATHVRSEAERLHAREVNLGS